MTWKALEENVKTLAGFIWNRNAVPAQINGINYDCVVKLREDYWIIVEVTEDEKLEKVRLDIAKFSAGRQFLFSQDIYAQFYLVMRNEPTLSMVTTGSGCKVEVLSYDSFSKLFIDYKSYAHVRSKKVFGSSVNPISGEPDEIDYTAVNYVDVQNKTNLNLNGIISCVNSEKNIILLGNYGTGKSRCLRELFSILSLKSQTKILYPIAINLKENWGTQLRKN